MSKFLISKCALQLDTRLFSPILADDSKRTILFLNNDNLDQTKEKLETTPVIPLKESKRFSKECLIAAGLSSKFAKIHSDLLAEADIRGYYNNGFNRLGKYISEIDYGICDPRAEPTILQQSPSTAWVDAHNGLGFISGNFCMQLAIEKAKKTGIGWVVSKHCNHNGIAAWYLLQALRAGMLGVCFTNGNPLVVPTRSKTAAFGTNHISFAAPGYPGDYFLLDVATSCADLHKLEIAERLGKSIPKDWALDEKGNVTTNPTAAIKASRLMPIGGHKGSGLAMMVEILSGVTAGSRFSTRIRDSDTFPQSPDLGQCYIALDVSNFGDGFSKRLSEFLDIIRKLPPRDPKQPVLVPGEIEIANVKRHKKQGGIRYSNHQMKTCAQLAKRFHITPLRGRGKKKPTVLWSKIAERLNVTSLLRKKPKKTTQHSAKVSDVKQGNNIKSSK